jgi:hypothetical protein
VNADVSNYQKGEKGEKAVAADQKNLNTKASITNIKASVENDQQENVWKLAQVLGVTIKMVHNTLHKDLRLSKKSARWVSKLLYKEMKKERVRM